MFISEHVVEELKEVKPKFFKQAFPKIFSWQELENLLNLRPFVNDKRILVTTFEKYKFSRNEAWITDKGSIPPSCLQNAIEKYHCYLIDASRVNPIVNSICKELENIFLSSSADAHIYFDISETQTGGFGIHHDMSHNLIIQVEGQSRFKIWEESNCSNNRFIDKKNLSIEPFIDEILNPGDAVFIPMWTYHEAISLKKRMSISFPFNWRTPTAKSQDRHWIKLTET